MKIILKKDYDLLGDAGQVLDVKEGYARNFLIPNGIATIATASNLKSYEEVKRQTARKVQKQTEEAQKIASELGKFSVDIKVKTGEENKIFGSVTSQMIFDALKEKGFEDLDKKKIIIKEPIKSLGEHEVDIKLHSAVMGKIRVNVLSENELVEKPQEVATAESEKTEQPSATGENTDTKST